MALLPLATIFTDVLFLFAVDTCSCSFLFQLFRSSTALFSVSDVFPECLVSFCAFRSRSIFRMPLSDSPTWEPAISFAAEATVKSGYGLCKDSQRSLEGCSFNMHMLQSDMFCVISSRCSLHDSPLESMAQRGRAGKDSLRLHPGLWGVPANPSELGR